MLILSRKKHESIMIGDDVRIEVVAILGDKVRIGIEAGRAVPVHRREVWEHIHGQSDPEPPAGEGGGPC